MTDVPFLNELFWFCLGMLSWRLLSYLFHQGNMSIFVHQINLHALTLVGSIAQDISFINTIKYKELVKVGHSSEDIQRIKEIDTKTMNNWKESVIKKFYATWSNRYQLKFANWEQAMSVLDEYYKKNK